jgi:hypothetical protein
MLLASVVKCSMEGRQRQLYHEVGYRHSICHHINETSTLLGTVFKFFCTLVWRAGAHVKCVTV